MTQSVYSITQEYPGSFDEAITDITKALTDEGFGILTQIDVKETLKQKIDVDFKEYRILGACNPPNAHKALQAEIEIGLLLPCNVIVYVKGDQVLISVIKPTAAITLSNNLEVTKIALDTEEKLTRALVVAVKNAGSEV